MNNKIFEIKEVDKQNKVYALRYNIENLPFDLDQFDEMFCRLSDFFKDNGLIICGIPYETDLVAMEKEELIYVKKFIDNIIQEIDKREKI